MIHRENQARVSAILSSALLIISVVGLAGRPAAAAPHSSLPARLLPLVDDLEAQLRLSYEFNRPVYRERVQYTLAVIRAWQQSAQSPRDEALLEGWLHDAIERSLPGRRARLAAIPGFRSPPVDLLPAAEDRSPIA